LSIASLAVFEVRDFNFQRSLRNIYFTLFFDIYAFPALKHFSKTPDELAPMKGEAGSPQRFQNLFNFLLIRLGGFSDSLKDWKQLLVILHSPIRHKHCEILGGKLRMFEPEEHDGFRGVIEASLAGFLFGSGDFEDIVEIDELVNVPPVAFN
jgi:hypothetical protein